MRSEELFKVTLIAGNSEHSDEVNATVLELMLKADCVTIRNTTLEKKFTEVDEIGNVYFHGSLVSKKNNTR